MDGSEPTLIGVAGSARADLDAAREIAGTGSVVDLDEAEGAPDITALDGASPADDVRRFPSLRWVRGEELRNVVDRVAGY
ncbi:hypothetical protein [Brachybacterium sp. FME24]|uniref:hypothetical protein n=1 Tax=Brachybacterium sp. FME24 TaxID=2742605 RepID=UPI001867577C|nr:hypothetical protein [Brachybacterium sp. FME24]